MEVTNDPALQGIVVAFESMRKAFEKIAVDMEQMAKGFAALCDILSERPYLWEMLGFRSDPGDDWVRWMRRSVVLFIEGRRVAAKICLLEGWDTFLDEVDQIGELE